jgi:two-component system response regulator LytT
LNVDELIKALLPSIKPANDTHRERFLVRQGQRLLSISVDESAYFYGEGKVTFLKTTEGRFYSLDLSLEEVTQQVDPSRFFRASRSHLIERRVIRSVFADSNGKYRVMLQPASKEELLVSRDRAPEFKKWLGA